MAGLSGQDGKVDPRTLWLPATVVLALLGGVWFGGRMYERISTRAETTITLQTELKALNGSLSEVKGSLNTLMGMQAQLSNVSSDVGNLQSRLDAQDRRIETMDAWIQTTRDRMREQGIRPPDYRPGGTP